MNINYRKSLKLITLLLTSIFIATASATVYTTMYMKATPITVSASEVRFTTGSDTSSAGGTINSAGTEIVFTGMSVAPNATRTYTQAVNVTNFGTGNHKITLQTYSVTGNLTGFKYINVTIFSEAGVKQGISIRISPTLGNVTSTGQLTIGTGKIWSVQWILVTIDSGAKTGQTVSPTMKMDVE